MTEHTRKIRIHEWFELKSTMWLFECIGKTSARLRQQPFDNTIWLTGLIFNRIIQKRFCTITQRFEYIKQPLLTSIKNPTSNPVNWVHQVLHNMIVTKDLDSQIFDYVDPVGWDPQFSSLGSVSIEQQPHTELDASTAYLFTFIAWCRSPAQKKLDSFFIISLRFLD